MAEETEIEGLAELAAAMDALPPRVARSAVRPALNAAGQVFEAAVEATVPRGETGSLAESISRKVHVGANGDWGVLVGPAYQGGYKHTSADPGVRGKFLEFGTRKMPPRFFMRRAFAVAKNTAVDAATAVLRAVLENLPK